MRDDDGELPSLPPELQQLARDMLKLLDCASRAAQHAAKESPSKSGVYPVALLFDAEGNLIGDDSGKPIVTLTPLSIIGMKNDTVQFDLGDGINQLRTPKEAAEFLATSSSGYKRLRHAGLLDAPIKVGERRVAHTVAQLHDCLARMNEAKGKKRKRA
ncbi:hypothetical protein [Hyphomicrobium sp. DMF-1]|jgi:hypothetical protein|uniref:hypothetical protein n=1 Tax=Hyphomicrobium sp. DMF-1 TaxID=3019544 RepID=UPI0022EBC6A6|nr:hypothetical protein [Hyphomicrobium sp. DMF-1]WBT39184.1 hypothetical protein PE058_04695 [Hyphomicrobium sp. DMF-1]